MDPLKTETHVNLTEKGRVIATLLKHMDNGLHLVSALVIAYEAGGATDESFDVDAAVAERRS